MTEKNLVTATTLDGDQFFVTEGANRAVYCPVCRKTLWSGQEGRWPYLIARWTVEFHASRRGHEAKTFKVQNVGEVLLCALPDTPPPPPNFTYWENPDRVKEMKRQTPTSRPRRK